MTTGIRIHTTRIVNSSMGGYFVWIYLTAPTEIRIENLDEYKLNGSKIFVNFNNNASYVDLHAELCYWDRKYIEIFGSKNVSSMSE